VDRHRWWVVAALAASFVALTAALAIGAFLDIDIAVRDWCDTHRPEPLRLAAKSVYFLGSANLIAPALLALAIPIAVRDRTPGPVLRVLVTAAASYVVVVPLKILTDRSAPHAPWHDAVEIFANDAGWSYPSGHVVNAVIWYPVLVLLVERLRRRPLADRTRHAVLAVPVVVVFVAVTYLGFHWLTDSLAGLLLGLALNRVPPAGWLVGSAAGGGEVHVVLQ
jgi:membrane-associated phospholipid phosphatase